MNKVRRQIGMTLIEFMIAITVLAVLMTLAAPSFAEFLQNTRFSTTANDFLLAMRTARSEAIKRKSPVRVESTNANTDWSGGWQIKVVTSGQQIVVHEELARGQTLTGQSLAVFQFDDQGFLNQSDVLTLCGKSGQIGRRIEVLPSGQAKVEAHAQCI